MVGLGLVYIENTMNAAARYTIHANGSFQGVYLATNRDDALDVYAQDAGYDDYVDMCDRLDLDIDDTRSKLTVTEIDAIAIEVASVEPGDHDTIEADITVRAGSAVWSGGVTLGYDYGRPMVERRHPLGTCGTPLDGWASDQIREAVQAIEGLDGEIVATVDAAAQGAGL